MKQKHVLILGAGVAGLATAQALSREAHGKIRVTLVDKSDVHVLKADLYEVATAYNKEITDACLVRLRSTVATPIVSTVDPHDVHFIQDEVLAIHPKEKKVELREHKSLSYDVLVVALGSTSNFFGVSGAQKYVHPLRTVQEAIRINCDLDHLFLELYKKKRGRRVDIMVVGGGATGVETASELVNSLSRLCQKYRYPRSKVYVSLIQAGKNLGGLDEKGTECVAERLQRLGVCLYREYRVRKVNLSEVVLKDGHGKLKTLSSDFLIWTAGVRVNPVVVSLGEVKYGGAIRVDATMKAVNHSSIYAAGDNASLRNYPMLAPIAQSQGRLIAENILRERDGKALKSFKAPLDSMILPLGGRYALFKMGPWYFSGLFPWFIKRLIIFRYHLSVLPFKRAFRKWRLGEELFRGND